MFVCKNFARFIYLFSFLQLNFGKLNDQQYDGSLNAGARNIRALSEAKYFTCYNYSKEIALDDVCNGIINCRDLSDECMCEHFNKDEHWIERKPAICKKVVQFDSRTLERKESNCSAGQVDCGRCIERSSVCDGIVDCPDEADEQPSFCENKLTPKQSYSANYSNESQTPTPVSFTENIGDQKKMEQENIDRGQKEMSKGAFITNCTATKNKLEISIYENEGRCDKTFDCEDRSDEMECEDGRFYCEDEKSPWFVTKNKMHDGQGECQDWSDECPTNPNATGEIHSRNEIIGNLFLRVLVWIMAFMAITGNVAVMTQECKKIRKLFRKKLHGPVRANHLLILNLSLADLIMGIYLLMLGIVGLNLSGTFCQHQLEWCSGNTCHVMGSMAIIASEASVLTMVLLTSFRLYSLFNPFSSQDKPNLWVVLMLIMIAWGVSFFLALVPLTTALEVTFVPYALIRENPFINNVVINFDVVKSWAEKALTYDPFFTPDSAKIAFEKLQSATSYNGLRHALGGARSADYLHTSGLFGFYSSHSVCIPRFLLTTENHAWRYSIAITSFNFLAFLFVAASYSAIAFKATRRPKFTRKSEEKSKSVRLGSRKFGAKKAAMQWKIFRLIATDFCCWVPISILAFLSISGVRLDEVAHVVSAVVLLPINSALNPILYSDVFGSAFQSLRTRATTNNANSTSSTYTRRTKTSKGFSLPEGKSNSLEKIP